MKRVTLHATSFTLTAMTIDRYHAIVHPLSSMNWRNRKISTITCIFVWAVAFFISVPFALYHKTVTDEEDNTYCQEAWPDETLGKVILITVTGTNYVLPLTIIVICYYQILRNLWKGYRRKTGRSINSAVTSETQTRRKKRMTRMVAIIILLFATFWFPIHVINIYTKLYPEFPKTEPMFIIKVLAHTLSYANSCVNPFIYAFLNDRFKKSFVKTFPSLSYWFPCMRNIIEEMEHTRITNMVDQAIQAGADDNDNDHVEENCNHIQLQKLQETSLL
ncbi:galanin receptor type 1-like isoform X3 [Mytilus galloprovincialis]|uniref:galanin receptor type 1-like isoform X3 n=1 Tax=Mytilus galloprovincialis TaxID=29158 RepID=UPI003F7BDBDF